MKQLSRSNQPASCVLVCAAELAQEALLVCAAELAQEALLVCAAELAQEALPARETTVKSTHDLLLMDIVGRHNKL